jgi:hypothetical protein
MFSDKMANTIIGCQGRGSLVAKGEALLLQGKISDAMDTLKQAMQHEPAAKVIISLFWRCNQYTDPSFRHRLFY